MHSWKSRTSLILGEEGIEKLSSSNVLLIGVGGVGSSAAEMLVRSGIGKITIVDGDVIEKSNINRQLLSLSNNVGEVKVEVQASRLLSINPELEIVTINKFLESEDINDLLDNTSFDFVIDAIDYVPVKLKLMIYCKENNINLISSMAAGGRLDLSKIKVSDISKTYMCSMARNIRKELKKNRIYKGITVVFSTEEPMKKAIIKRSIGTVPYIPVAFGLHLASFVINKLIKEDDNL